MATKETANPPAMKYCFSSYAIGDAVRRTKNVSESALPRHRSGRAKSAPLGACGGAALLEILSAVEGALLVEMVMSGAVNRRKFLQTSHPPKAKHRPLSSSKRLMRVLGAVVQPPAYLTLVDHAEALERCAV